MSDGDLFREVDQAVRQERYRLLWDRFGYYIIGVAALIVLVVAGYRGWVYWQQKQAQETGAEFVSAMELLQAENTEKAEKAFEELADDAPNGYETLSRFQIAAAEANAGNTKEAIAKYDAIAEDGSVDSILRGNAVIQAATLRLPDADYAEMERRLQPLIDNNSPWRYSARDLLGLSAYRVGDMETAQDHFNTLLADSGTPANLRERTTVMLAVISGALSSGEAPGGTEAAPEPKATPAAEETPAAETPAEGAVDSPAEEAAPQADTMNAPDADNAATPDEDSSASSEAPSTNTTGGPSQEGPSDTATPDQQAPEDDARSAPAETPPAGGN